MIDMKIFIYPLKIQEASSEHISLKNYLDQLTFLKKIKIAEEKNL
jgi:hypothetical protein